MLFSCFDPERGDYQLFEDDGRVAVNSDLPVPSFRSHTKLGVPAIHAGRPLPAGATPAGRSWNARGIVVDCGAAPLSAFSGEPSATAGPSALELAVFAAGVGAGLYLVSSLWSKP
jgi:hypothetical protein